jgi:DNA repair protein RecO (recombination protein O)
LSSRSCAIRFLAKAETTEKKLPTAQRRHSLPDKANRLIHSGVRSLSTDALVLHILDYSESSRIVKLATRDAGVVSALARGARRPKSRFGSALDLFADGTAHLLMKEGRDLHTLAAFEPVHARPTLGRDLGRFTGAAAIAELALRFSTDDPMGAVYPVLADALDTLAETPDAYVTTAALAGAWRLLEALGFAPALSECAGCHTPLAPDEDVLFAHSLGGAVCARCGQRALHARRVPAAARANLTAWLAGTPVRPLPPDEGRAHQRLLREFVRQHLEDGRPLRAFAVWEHGGWAERRAEHA